MLHTGIVLVSSSTIFVNSSIFSIIEGESTQSLGFSFTFSPSALATYSVGGAGTSDLWGFAVFFSGNPTGAFPIGGTPNLDTLTVAQRQTLWSPPDSTTIVDIQAPDLPGSTGYTCDDMQYLCARLTQGTSPSPAYVLQGVPTDDSLIACTEVPCRGVEITNSELSVTSPGALREGAAGQTVSFNFTLTAGNAGSRLTGTNLWQFTAFGSQTADGSSVSTDTYNVPLTPGQGSTGIASGGTASFGNLGFEIDLSGDVNCADVPYICVTASRGESASPAFTLSGVPSDDVLTSCQPVTCRGVELDNTALNVTGFVLEGEENNVNLYLTLSANAGGGSAVGSGLWSVTGFASNYANGSGVRFGEDTINLTPSQANTTLNYGETATIDGLIFNLDLQSGPVCSQFRYICVEIEKGSAPSPDFDLTPAQSVSCYEVECRGVEITNSAISVTDPGALREGVAGQTVSFNLNLTAGNAGSVSGTNLWQFTAFGSQTADGSSVSTDTYNVPLTPGQGSTGIASGGTAIFDNLSFEIDLSGDVNCADVPYICVTASRGESANPAFTLSGVPSDDVLTSCQPVTCRGVELDSSMVTVVGSVRQGESTNVTLLVLLEANAGGGSAVGSGLWSVTGFASNYANGSGVRFGENTINLTPSQANTTLNYGETATIDGLIFNLDLQSGPVCSQFRYICVEIEKGSTPSPDFDLTPAQSVSCYEVECRGVEITNSAISVTDPGALREGVAGQTVSFNLNLTAGNAGSVSGTNLWQFTAFGSQTADGSSVSTDTYNVPLTPGQGSTGIASGGTAIFDNLGFEIDLSGDVNCADVPYICVTASRGESASPDFTLSGDPSDDVLTSCQPVTCRGVELDSSMVTVVGFVRQGESTNVTLLVLLEANAGGGSAVGSDLWSLTGFASNYANGSGVRFGENTINLTPSQANTTLNYGMTATIDGLIFNVDLQSGPLCSQFRYICVEIEKGSAASPDFDLTPAQSVSCYEVECRGVNIASLNTTLNTDEVFHGQSQSVSFNVQASADPDYGSVSGTGLWVVTAWVSDSLDGANPIATSNISLSASQADQSAESGGTISFSNLAFPLNLNTTPECADFSFFCVQLQRDSGSSVDFSLEGDLDSG
ncbi:uncharacterized protein [Diadema antillarum]|uniref:uncharacterized protein n=1 Tax=Diadema antillarum TaxID=105358 RepID=UPI003A86A640